MLLPYLEKDRLEAGCDEAGRGCLAGPVVAAAVILPLDFSHPHLNDSKKMTEADREALVPIIKEHAISFGIAEVSNTEIDDINILNASFLAMNRAVEQLQQIPDHLLIDGNRFRTEMSIPYTCVIKGDGKYASIAAASVLAKTYRDELMKSLARDFPQYGWQTNVGYPTIKHRDAIRAHGPTKHHRMSFQLLTKQLDLFKKD
ncbi:MAG: ribonuclease HII [Cyclobacteriaceae bacterium]|jgi:ribonuclease HII